MTFIIYTVMETKSRRMRRAGHVARVRKMINIYKILVGKPEEEKILGRTKRRWEENIRIDSSGSG